MRMSYRVFSVICAVLLMAGCTKLSGGKTREDVLAAAAAPFTFTGTVTMEGISRPVRLKAAKTASGLTVELLSPETVKGLTVEFSEERVKTTFCGLVMNLSPRDIPQQSLFIAMRDVLSAVPGEDAQFSEGGGMVTVAGNAGMLPYELVWRADSLGLQAIKLPSMGGIIQVESFTKTT